ncbi:MAG: efflux RND transporter periplasmic adaptor subunit, partial [Verrucomicrobiota bacterium]
MNKKLKLSLIVAGLAGLAWPAWVHFSGSPKRPASSTVTAEARAERRDIQETVEASGFVRAVTYSTIRAQVSGPILKLHVQTGDMVKKDQVLVELDPVLANADETEDRRNVQLQTLTLERLERDLRRVEVLVKKGFVSEREVLDHRTAFDVAKLQRDIAQARLDKAVENVRRT